MAAATYQYMRSTRPGPGVCSNHLPAATLSCTPVAPAGCHSASGVSDLLAALARMRLCVAASCVCACLQAATGLEWRDMFFDDESGNVHKVRGGAAGTLGLPSIEGYRLCRAMCW